MEPDDRVRSHDETLTLLITLNVKMVAVLESLDQSLARLTQLLHRLTPLRP